MAFNYIGDLSTELDQIRFKIGDTVENAGVKPASGNYSDEEINGLLAIELTVGRTTAALAENLAMLYANYVDAKMGPRDEKLSQKQKAWERQAKIWRDEYGRVDSQILAGTIDFLLDEDEDSLESVSGDAEDES